MRIPRIYINTNFVVGQSLALDQEASGHLLRVLRLGVGDEVKVFDGKGIEFLSTIQQVGKKTVVVSPTSKVTPLSESPLYIHLGQSISRGDKMDYCLQKSVELGVQKITPIFTERCGVKLSQDRVGKKMQHWQKVIISACQQCGRAFVPELMPVQMLADWMASVNEQMRFVLSPSNKGKLKDFEYNQEKIALLIGSEGGLTEQEIEEAKQKAFVPLQLGPRVLRTETAGPAAITALQCLWGDLG